MTVSKCKCMTFSICIFLMSENYVSQCSVHAVMQISTDLGTERNKTQPKEMNQKPIKTNCQVQAMNPTAPKHVLIRIEQVQVNTFCNTMYFLNLTVRHLSRLILILVEKQSPEISILGN